MRYLIVLYCIGCSIYKSSQRDEKGLSNVKIISSVLMLNQTARASPDEMLISESYLDYTVCHCPILGTIET